MNNEKIEKILLKHNEWNAFDDEVKEGICSIEYSYETLKEVIQELETYCKAREREAYKEGATVMADIINEYGGEHPMNGDDIEKLKVEQYLTSTERKNKK